MNRHLKNVLTYFFFIACVPFCDGQIGITCNDSIILIQRTYYATGPSGPSQGPQYYYTHNYFFINGDSLVLGKVYKKMFYYYSPITQNPIPSSIDYSQLKLNSLLFQDSGKIYKGTLANMELIIDYNLNPGDSFKFKGYSPKLILLNFDSVSIGSNYYQRFNFENGVKWIKGIGDAVYGAHFSSYGFFNPSTFPGVYWFASNLMCYSERGTSILGNYCPINTSVKTHNNTFEVSLFPNPANDRLNIFFNKEQLVKSCEVYGIDGRLVKAASVKGSPILQLTINVNDLPDGIYFVKGSTADGYAVKKIIVQR